jgi:hypothetical protein
MVSIVLVSGCVTQSKEQTSGSRQSQQSVDFFTYENQQYGISVDYPKNWTVQEGAYGAIAAFISPSENTADFRENVLLMEENISDSATLEKYDDVAIGQLSDVITEFKLLESSDTTFAGLPAIKTIFTGVQGKFGLKWMEILTIKNRKGYAFVYTAEASGYDRFLQTADTMANSFRIA